MKPLLTYRPKSPGTNIGGYRYFFNGQEGDEAYLTAGDSPLVKFFRYDKLNRIKRMRTAVAAWNPLCNPSDNLATDYTYDFNGNLKTMRRNGPDAGVLHAAGYQYSSGRNRIDSICKLPPFCKLTHRNFF